MEKLLKTKLLNTKSDDQLMKMNLQFFADGGDGAGAGDGGSGEGDGANGTGDPVDPGDGAISFKNQSELDSWFDKRMEKSLSTARNNWDKEQQKKLEEAEKKGKMTAEEKAQYDLKQEREALEADRLSLKKDKDEALTIKKLASDKLPDDLSAVFGPLYGSEEKTLEDAYTNVSKAFRDAVEQAVNVRLAGSASNPAGNGGSSTSETTASKMAKEANTRNESHDDLWTKKK